MTLSPPSGLYIHVPFCRVKCGYCDFVSGVYSHEVRCEYLAALRKELAHRLERVHAPLETVYVGGGSPSSLEDGEWDSLVDLVRGVVAANEITECTVEMNPCQVTAAKVAALEGCATRVSVGAQTFEPALRHTLGRTPADPACIDRACAMIREKFLLNIDLMHTIPGQTMEMVERDIDRAAACSSDHVSAYALTVEPGTPLGERIARGELAMPDEDSQAETLAHTRGLLAARGYRQYEISNFALPGKECLHNLAVWAGGEYLGVGAAACSHLDGERSRNEPDVARYIERIGLHGDATAERERLGPAERAGEYAMLGLRTRAGISIEAFACRTGFDPLLLFEAAIRRHEAAGLLERTATHIRLTERGLDLANTVMADFIQEPAPERAPHRHVP
jgi:oxygen-independent coproporphyrinogen III oxidase